ncbi:MAG: hypothetical protein GXP30_11200 [Verrucomicrobia bacterium]|nr:hypothetical protein [Verrucomicrobiota bacterium]
MTPYILTALLLLTPILSSAGEDKKALGKVKLSCLLGGEFWSQGTRTYEYVVEQEKYKDVVVSLVIGSRGESGDYGMVRGAIKKTMSFP